MIFKENYNKKSKNYNKCLKMNRINYIFHLIPGFMPITRGGAEIFAFNLCKHLPKYCYKPIIITRGYKGLNKSDYYEGIMIKRFWNLLPEKIKRFGLGSLLKSKYLRMMVAFFDIIGELLLMLKLYKRYRIKIVHSSFIVPTGFIGVIFKIITGIPLIITVHGPADFYTTPKFIHPLLSLILKKADRVITVSKRLETDIKRKFQMKNVCTILNGVTPVKRPNNHERWVSKIMLKYQLDKNIHYPILIITGRLVKIKRVDLIIRAIPILKKSYPNIKLVILGEGIERSNLEKLGHQLKLDENIIMPGWIPENDKWGLLYGADLYIHLSREEGLSLSLLESQFAGLPVIVPKSNFVKEIINEGYNGLYLNGKLDAENISSKILQLLENPNLMKKFSGNALKNSNKFTLDAMVKNYVSEYQKIL